MFISTSGIRINKVTVALFYGARTCHIKADVRRSVMREGTRVKADARIPEMLILKRVKQEMSGCLKWSAFTGVPNTQITLLASLHAFRRGRLWAQTWRSPLLTTRSYQSFPFYHRKCNRSKYSFACFACYWKLCLPIFFFLPRTFI